VLSPTETLIVVLQIAVAACDACVVGPSPQSIFSNLFVMTYHDNNVHIRL